MTLDRRLIEARLRLQRLAIGGWAAQVLFAATELRLFDELAARPLTTAEVAAALGTDEDATGRLLGALVAIGLVERDGERFHNRAVADAYLTSNKPESMSTWVSLIGRWNRVFAELVSSVRNGGPAELPEDHLGAAPEYTRSFILGMHDYAIGPGRELARHLDLSDRRRLLDVGGGPGTYSVLLSEANPELECVVFDLPQVVEIAGEVIARHRLSDRVTTAAGDYHADPLPEGFDVALVSNVLHQEDWETCVGILRNAHSALEPGGLLVVQAMFLSEKGDGPMWPALHNLLMLLVYRGGRAYSVGDTHRMLAEAGFENPQTHHMSPFNAESFVTATRP
jgi:SAM-dependent methyltransferase